MRAEAREEAEAATAKAAQIVRENVGIDPEIVIREGSAAEQINAVIEEDRDIALLVLAARFGQGRAGTAGVVDRGTRRSLSDPRYGVPGYADERGNRRPQLICFRLFLEDCSLE